MLFYPEGCYSLSLSDSIQISIIELINSNCFSQIEFFSVLLRELFDYLHFPIFFLPNHLFLIAIFQATHFFFNFIFEVQLKSFQIVQV